MITALVLTEDEADKLASFLSQFKLKLHTEKIGTQVWATRVTDSTPITRAWGKKPEAIPEAIPE